MKRNLILAVFFSFLIVDTTLAQTHLKFMGIPLNGTISNFQTKLAQKGFTPNASANKVIGAGCRCFGGGTFSGEDAKLYVYYNPKTKIVYRAKAVIERNSDDNVESLFNKFNLSISNKYAECSTLEEGTQEGFSTKGYTIYNEDDTVRGYIDLYISKGEYSFSPRSLHVDYYDSSNYRKNNSVNSDDL